jgi:hypothetical protein
MAKASFRFSLLEVDDNYDRDNGQHDQPDGLVLSKAAFAKQCAGSADSACGGGARKEKWRQANGG